MRSEQRDHRQQVAIGPRRDGLLSGAHRVAGPEPYGASRLKYWLASLCW
jgi:hypothetical protein